VAVPSYCSSCVAIALKLTGPTVECGRESH
jgi:hypothetical protein